MSKYYYYESNLPEPPVEPTFFCSECELECQAVGKTGIGNEFVRILQCPQCEEVGQVRLHESEGGEVWVITRLD